MYQNLFFIAQQKPPSENWERKGTKKALDVECAEPCKFAKHQCSPLCVGKYF